MTTANPFAAAAPARTETPAAPAPATPPPPAAAPPAPAAAAPAPSTISAGDPFADPVGVSGDNIKDMLGCLLLLKPTEIIPTMATKKGTATDVVRTDIAILDNTADPGYVARGVLVFQTVLKRELGIVFHGPDTYQIGRLVMGAETEGKSAPYLFETATEADKVLARQFLAVTRL